MKKNLIYLMTIMMLSHFAYADIYTLSFRDSKFGLYSNYPDVRIKEICVHGVGYLVSDEGYMLVAVDQHNNPLVCKELNNEKTKPTAQNH